MAPTADPQPVALYAAAKAQADNTDILSTRIGLVTAEKENNDRKQDSFWEFQAAVDLAGRWNKSYPFQLLLLEKTAGGGYRVRDAFTLPVPPQELSISAPFAINSAVTLGGYIEEHNGAPIRMISVAGTTGVTPLRGTVARAVTYNVAESAFSGTISAVQNAGQAVGAALATLGLPFAAANVTPQADYEGEAGKGTGFFQFMLLQRFLETYATMKKYASGRDLRLAFAIWKEQAVYLVTPITFNVRRTAASPLEYQYDMQFKAWKRIVLAGTAPAAGVPGRRDPGAVAKVLNTLEGAQRVIEAASDILGAAIGDVRGLVLEPLRGLKLMLKDSLGLALTVADLPPTIASAIEDVIAEGRAIAGTAVAGADAFSGLRSAEEAFRNLGMSTGKLETGAADYSITVASQRRKGGHGNKGLRGAINKMELGSFNLRRPVLLSIEVERARAVGQTRTRLETQRNGIQFVLNQFCDAVGAGNATVTRIYGLPQRSSSRREPTDADLEIIHALSQSILAFDSTIVNTPTIKPVVDPIQYTAGLATRSGIAFQVPRSKFSVPFPYDATLEQVSKQYLGDPDRWHELAALNGLQSPYVDEVGFQLRLLVNGSGSRIVVPSNSGLYINQPVWIGSNVVRREARRINRIQKLSATQTALTLSGEGDLERFTISGEAYIQAFLPNTVNSSQTLFIPSGSESEEPDDFRVKQVPGVDYNDPLVRTGGIDLLLDSGGDVVITSSGVTRLAVGLTNIVQRIRLALLTPPGALMRHPDYGFGVRYGSSTADVDVQTLMANARSMFRNDPVFSGVESIEVRKGGNFAAISMSVRLAATNQLLPITVPVSR